MNFATKWGIERDGVTSICRDIYIAFQVECISGFISEMKDPEGQMRAGGGNKRLGKLSQVVKVAFCFVSFDTAL